MLVRYALVVVIAWIGALKYISVEARGIEPLIHNSPFTTPGVTVASAGGFPVLSVVPGQFLLKDLVLIAASLWTLGDSLDTARRRASPFG